MLKKIHHEKIWRWILSDPKTANSIGPTMQQALEKAMLELETANSTPATRPAILVLEAAASSTKNPVWISGGNIAELASLKTAETLKAYSLAMNNFCQKLTQIPQLVIAVIDGAAIGGGAELALFSDLRLATARSSLHFKQLSIGLSTGYGGGQRLVKLAGLAWAKKLIFLRQPLQAKQAFNIGLIDEVFLNASHMRQRLGEILQDLITLNSEALAIQKSILENADSEQKAFCTLWQNPTHRGFLEQFLK